MLDSVIRAKSLVKDGWTTHAVHNLGSYDFIGALGEAAFGAVSAGYQAQALWALKKEWWVASDHDLWDFFYDIYLMLGFPHNDPPLNAVKALIDFNDSPNTTKEDIIHAFDIIIGYLS
jgi:hypothetical protein